MTPDERMSESSGRLFYSVLVGADYCSICIGLPVIILITDRETGVFYLTRVRTNPILLATKTSQLP